MEADLCSISMRMLHGKNAKRRKTLFPMILKKCVPDTSPLMLALEDRRSYGSKRRARRRNIVMGRRADLWKPRGWAVPLVKGCQPAGVEMATIVSSASHHTIRRTLEGSTMTGTTTIVGAARKELTDEARLYRDEDPITMVATARVVVRIVQAFVPRFGTAITVRNIKTVSTQGGPVTRTVQQVTMAALSITNNAIPCKDTVRLPMRKIPVTKDSPSRSKTKGAFGGILRFVAVLGQTTVRAIQVIITKIDLTTLLMDPIMFFLADPVRTMVLEISGVVLEEEALLVEALEDRCVPILARTVHTVPIDLGPNAMTVNVPRFGPRLRMGRRRRRRTTTTITTTLVARLSCHKRETIVPTTVAHHHHWTRTIVGLSGSANAVGPAATHHHHGSHHPREGMHWNRPRKRGWTERMV